MCLCGVPFPLFLPNHFIDLLQISGYWYSILLASDVREKIEEGGSMRVFVKHIEVLSNSSLLFNMYTK